MNRRRTRCFRVTIELPKQELNVYAFDAADAELKAFNMVGLAGLRHFGTLEAERLDEPVAGAASR